MNPRTRPTERTAIKKSYMKKLFSLPDGGNGPRRGGAAAGEGQHTFSGNAAGLCVRKEYLLYRFKTTRFRFIKYVLDDPGNLVKTDAALQESGHSDLVGGVQGDRFDAASFRRFVGQPQTYKFLHIWRSEVEMP